MTFTAVPEVKVNLKTKTARPEERGEELFVVLTESVTRRESPRIKNRLRKIICWVWTSLDQSGPVWSEKIWRKAEDSLSRATTELVLSSDKQLSILSDIWRFKFKMFYKNQKYFEYCYLVKLGQTTCGCKYVKANNIWRNTWSLYNCKCKTYS